MNILFTCAGRRNYLLQYFRESLAGAGKIIAVDSDLNAPALQDADIAVKVSNVYDSEYVSDLLNVCEEHNVKGLISLNDIELPILSINRNRFSDAGVRLFLSDNEIIKVCSDKSLTARFLVDNGFETPATYVGLEAAVSALNSNELSFPLMVKPRWGSASIGIHQVNDIEELELAHKFTQRLISSGGLAKVGLKNKHGEPNGTAPSENVIIQEWIVGSEYGLDILNNLDGQFTCVYAKRKLGMRAGETDKAMLVNCPELEALGQRLGENLRHVGNLDVDVFKSESDGRYVVLELNPRFGGGYPFSHELGARYPQALIAWALNQTFDQSTQSKTYDKIISKCDRLIQINNK